MLVKQLLFSSFVVVHSQQGVVQNLRDLSTDFNNSYMATNNPTFSPTSLPTSQPTEGLVAEKNNNEEVPQATMVTSTVAFPDDAALSDVVVAASIEV